VAVVTIDRPEVRNAVDAPTAALLVSAFKRFDADPSARVAVLTGAGRTFCAGFDLKAVARGDPPRVAEDGPSPMGPARMELSKPVIAGIEGHAVGGGLELALWCDLRIAARDAVLGVFNRRFGVPLVDTGTIRLPRIVGHGRAMDLILTGRPVDAEEALVIGLVSRLAESGHALDDAAELARAVASHPQAALRADRASAVGQWSLAFNEAVRAEVRGGLEALAGEAVEGARRFVSGEGRGGRKLDGSRHDG
jgi:enoyl-CoA hydratase